MLCLLPLEYQFPFNTSHIFHLQILISPPTMSPSALSPPSPSRHYTIASIPADGIGPEVISAGITVLQQLSKTFSNFSFEFTHFPWSSDFYLAHGHYIPPGGLDALKKFDAILFGAVGDLRVPDHISLWGLRLAICQPLQQFANVRPTRVLRGVTSPLAACQGSVENAKKLDWVIVRENSEGEYAGHGGRSHVAQTWETATEVSIFTRHGIERIMRFAFEVAKARPRRKLTVVSKSNAQRNGMVLWDEVAKEIEKEYPEVEVDKMLVDAMTCRMTLQPETIDTVVATNLHADILSDLAAALAGSIGIAPTSNLDPTRKNPSMFEPIHGSAWDIAGKGVANPVGTFWTCAEMVRWLGEDTAADTLMEAIENTIGSGIRTKDLGGSAGTEEVTRAVCEEIQKIGGSKAKEP
jgi:tartrate dehydrogenase